MVRGVTVAALLLAVVLGIIHAHGRAGRAVDARDEHAKRVQARKDELVVLEGEAARLSEALSETAKRHAFEIRYFSRRGVPEGLEQAPLKGRVLASNSEADVCVVSLGTRDGVAVGSEFVIARGDTYIATLEVTHVKAGMAAGKQRPGLSKGIIHRGDTALGWR